ncbi:MAG: M57 family metalloprotease [Micrococcales bacterium]|nr:M57 family metalloprotease [Micrococcales bacterium]
MSATAIALVASSATVAVAATGEVPTYKQFQAATYQDADTQYIVNGDEPVRTNGELRSFYDSMVAAPKQTSTDRLVVNTVSGRDDKWSASQVANLTYCVSTKFGADQARVAQAVADGAALWEAASSKVNFVYVPSQNGSCTVRNSNVVFSVEPSKSTQYIARAFFPSTPKSGRNVLVVTKSLFNSGSWTPQNILGHELGHTLGFRHEHTRPEAGTCFEDNNWRPLTAYDSSSIMHYPQCNGSSDDLSMTSTDRAGVQALYGS